MRTLKVITLAVLLSGTLAWAQTQPQTAPAPEKKTKHVITEDELVATRPPDFVPSAPEPKAEDGAATQKDGEAAAEAAGAPVAPSADTQARIEELKKQEAVQQQKVSETEAKLAAAKNANEKETYQGSLDNAKAYLANLQQQREALENPSAAKPAGKPAERQEAQPKQDEQPPQ